MMLDQSAGPIYAYIMDAEFIFLRMFKINPYEIMRAISMLDLQSYLNELERRNKKEQDSIQKKDLEKALVQLRDVLIFITMGKDGLRMRL